MIGASGGATEIYASIPFSVQMRANPTLSLSGIMKFSDIAAANFDQSSASVIIDSGRISIRGVNAGFQNFSGLTNFRPYIHQITGNSLLLSAEL
jgi:hypothetical protein